MHAQDSDAIPWHALAGNHKYILIVCLLSCNWSVTFLNFIDVPLAS